MDCGTANNACFPAIDRAMAILRSRHNISSVARVADDHQTKQVKVMKLNLSCFSREEVIVVSKSELRRQRRVCIPRLCELLNKMHNSMQLQLSWKKLVALMHVNSERQLNRQLSSSVPLKLERLWKYRGYKSKQALLERYGAYQLATWYYELCLKRRVIRVLCTAFVQQQQSAKTISLQSTNKVKSQIRWL